MLILRLVPALFLATAANAHTVPLDHVHHGTLTVYPMLAGLVVILGAAILGYRQRTKP